MLTYLFQSALSLHPENMFLLCIGNKWVSDHKCLNRVIDQMTRNRAPAGDPRWSPRMVPYGGTLKWDPRVGH